MISAQASRGGAVQSDVSSYEIANVEINRLFKLELSKVDSQTAEEIRSVYRTDAAPHPLKPEHLASRRRFLCNPQVQRTWESMMQHRRLLQAEFGTQPEGLDVFDYYWHASGHPIVEVSSLIEAELMCTDIGDAALQALKAPWPAFCITSNFNRSDLICVLEVDSVWQYVYNTTPWQAGFTSPPMSKEDCFRSEQILPSDETARRKATLIRRLIGNLCIALTNGDISLKKYGPKLPRNGRRAEPEHFKAQADVKVDLTPVIRAYLAGETGPAWKLRVRSFVRGHWRRPPKRGVDAQKTVWVRPHWHGPLDAEAVVRKHVVVA